MAAEKWLILIVSAMHPAESRSGIADIFISRFPNCGISCNRLRYLGFIVKLKS